MVMAQQKFSAQVADWVAKTKALQLAIFRESAQRIVNIAQEPVAAGGNMPVQTGYLRATGRASIGEANWSVTYKPDGQEKFGYSEAQAVLTIAKASLDDVIFFVWTANYAPYVEAKRGFVRLAAQQWQSVVNQVAREAITGSS
jgi:hypothetical protein